MLLRSFRGEGQQSDVENLENHSGIGNSDAGGTHSLNSPARTNYDRTQESAQAKRKNSRSVPRPEHNHGQQQHGRSEQTPRPADANCQAGR